MLIPVSKSKAQNNVRRVWRQVVPHSRRWLYPGQRKRPRDGALLGNHSFLLFRPRCENSVSHVERGLFDEEVGELSTAEDDKNIPGKGAEPLMEGKELLPEVQTVGNDAYMTQHWMIQDCS